MAPGVWQGKLSEDELRLLQKWAGDPESDRELSLRATMLLMSSEGLTSKAIASRLGKTTHWVRFWRWRHVNRGIGSFVPRQIVRSKEEIRREEAKAARAEARAEELRKIQELMLTPPPFGWPDRWTAAKIGAELGIRSARVISLLSGAGIRLCGPPRQPRPPEDMETLAIWAGGGAPRPELARRASAVLNVLGGMKTSVAAGLCGTHAKAVYAWKTAFMARGPAGLGTGMDRDGIMQARAEKVRERVAGRRRNMAALVAGPPPDGHVAWSAEALARQVGMSLIMIERDLVEMGLALPRSKGAVRRARKSDVRLLKRLSGSKDHATAWKARMLLMSFEGASDGEVARACGAAVAEATGLRTAYAASGTEFLRSLAAAAPSGKGGRG